MANHFLALISGFVYLSFPCYSWDVGAAHFIIFSTEVYFFVEDGLRLAEYQYNWLEEDLKV